MHIRGWPEIAFLVPKTPSPGHLFKRRLGNRQEEDKAWTQRPATEDKRRTRPGHRAQPQSSGARPREKVSRTLSNHAYKRWPEIACLVPKTPSPGHLFKRRLGNRQEEDKSWTQRPAEDKRRTRPGHRTEPSHRGQEEDKASTQSLATDPSHKVQRQPVSVASLFF